MYKKLFLGIFQKFLDLGVPPIFSCCLVCRELKKVENHWSKTIGYTPLFVIARLSLRQKSFSLQQVLTRYTSIRQFDSYNERNVRLTSVHLVIGSSKRIERSKWPRLEVSHANVTLCHKSLSLSFQQFLSLNRIKGKRI